MKMCDCGHNQIMHYLYASYDNKYETTWNGRCKECDCQEFKEKDMTESKYIVCCSGELDEGKTTGMIYSARNPEDIYMMSGLRKLMPYKAAKEKAEHYAAKFPDAKFYVAELKTISTTTRPVVTKEFGS